MQVYAEWAKNYDQDLIHEMAYVAPEIASRLLNNYETNREVQLLDAGCGTGLVGECLKELGYKNIDGLDYSHSMLEKAREKRIYDTLVQADLTTSLGIPDNHYDAAICVGTFTCGHVGPAALHELIRVVKPGGTFCFTVREQAWDEDNYHVVMEEIEQKGDWKLLEEKTADYIQQEGSKCKACLYQITSA
ncbi:MAG: class I SAM-dependent methyltransferase [Thermodesulfobacteriota bacterium]